MDSVSLATGGLFFSWLAHDLEELATMPGWTHPALDKIPFLPDDIRRNGCSREHVYLGIGLMGGLMAAASIDGYRTRGHSFLYQAVLYGYGMHTFSHLATAALARRRRCRSSCPSGSSRSGHCEPTGSRCDLIHGSFPHSRSLSAVPMESHTW